MIDFSVYQHINYEGVEYRHQGDTDGYLYCKNLHEAGNWGDQISSVKVRGGYVIFFQHINFGGSQYEMGPGELHPELGSWNDQISSFIACNNRFNPLDAINTIMLE